MGDAAGLHTVNLPTALSTASSSSPAAPAQAKSDPVDEEPLYVNAKQYHRILKRRTARARLEELHRLSKERKVCWFFCLGCANLNYVLFFMKCVMTILLLHRSHIFMNPATNMHCADLGVLVA